MSCNTIPYITIPYYTLPYNTIHYIPYITLPFLPIFLFLLGADYRTLVTELAKEAFRFCAVLTVLAFELQVVPGSIQKRCAWEHKPAEHTK